MTSTSIWQLSTTASSNTAIAGINIAENCAAANINDAIRELCAEVVGALKSVQATGTADALLASITPAPTALVDGMVVFVRAAAANATTTPTFVLNSIGSALTITQFGGQAVAAGAIAGANHELILRYVAADPSAPHWELLNPMVTAGVTSIADATNGGLHYSASSGAVTANLAPSDLLTKSSPTTSDSVVIMDAAASNAAKTSTLAQLATAINPANQQLVRAWGLITQSGGSYSVAAGSPGVSVAKNSTGIVTVTHGVTMASANYAAMLLPIDSGAAMEGVGQAVALTTTTVKFANYNGFAPGNQDWSTGFMFIICGS